VTVRGGMRISCQRAEINSTRRQLSCPCRSFLSSGNPTRNALEEAFAKLSGGCKGVQ
jgi:hypothetical protein